MSFATEAEDYWTHRMREMREQLKTLPGPWNEEPDSEEWYSPTGLPCLVVRGAFAQWCGYVAVPPGHPWHGKYNELDVDVHGGLTYASACAGHVCHVPRPGEPDNVWWLGFDFGHGGDFSPGLAVQSDRMRSLVKGLPGEPYEVSPFSFDTFDARNYATLARVKAECERLAQQAVAAS